MFLRLLTVGELTDDLYTADLTPFNFHKDACDLIAKYLTDEQNDKEEFKVLNLHDVIIRFSLYENFDAAIASGVLKNEIIINQPRFVVVDNFKRLQNQSDKKINFKRKKGAKNGK